LEFRPWKDDVVDLVAHRELSEEGGLAMRFKLDMKKQENDEKSRG
jgi:hypothetical protein